MSENQRLRILWLGAMALSLSVVPLLLWGEQPEDKVKIISVPQPEFKALRAYDGTNKVALTTFEDCRFVEDRRYLGVTQTGMFNHPRPLMADEDAGSVFEKAVRLGLSSYGISASSADVATIRLGIKLLGIAYSEQTFMASEYGMAEVLFLATLSSEGQPNSSEGANADGSKKVLVRAFFVNKAGDATKHAPYVLQMAMKDAVGCGYHLRYKISR